MKKLKNLFILFLTMFKIGLFTFGGGYAMIAIIERELVEKKKWIPHEEFLDIIAIAESSPGPLAINSATYIGYKICGVLGSIFATLGVVIPSFIIIFVISLFFDKFLSFEYVNYAFRGIQAAVIFLIASAGIKMFKHIKHNFFNVALFTLTAACMIVFALFSVNFSTIFYILIGGFLGLTIYLISLCSNKKNKIKKENVAEESKEKNELNNGEGNKNV